MTTDPVIPDAVYKNLLVQKYKQGQLLLGDDERLNEQSWAATPSIRTIGTGATESAAGDHTHTEYTTYITASGSSVGPSNTVTETTLLSQSVSNVVAGDALELKMWGEAYNNSGGSITATWKIKIGSTTVLTSTALSLATATSRRKWFMTATVAIPTLSTQSAGASINVSAATSDTLPVGASSINGAGYGTATEDFTTAKNFIVTMTLGSADPACEVLSKGHILTKIGS